MKNLALVFDLVLVTVFVGLFGRINCTGVLSSDTGTLGGEK
jgi:hypothetical protein